MCTVVDPATATITWANAGHPPPLLRRPDGSTAFLDEASGPALGATAGASYSTGHAAVEAGSMIVLYTDGLIERRHEDMRVGLERLARQVAECEGPASACCADLVGERVAGELIDDLAVVVIEARPRLEPLSVRFPNEASSLARLRAELSPWLRTLVQDPARSDLVQAAGEAAAKAVVHAGSPVEGDLALSASCAGDTVEVRIRTYRSRGAGPAPGIDSGRALLMMEALTDSSWCCTTTTGPR